MLGMESKRDLNFCRNSPVGCCTASAHVGGFLYFRPMGENADKSPLLRQKRGHTKKVRPLFSFHPHIRAVIIYTAPLRAIKPYTNLRTSRDGTRSRVFLPTNAPAAIPMAPTAKASKT